jgi:XTP/dITP diphosphohydrolase
MRLTFVTGNPGKVREARAHLEGLGVELTQDDRGYPEVQAEDLEAVARFAADQLRGEAEAPFVLEDAGLFVDALDGFPGVYSSYVHDTLGLEGLLDLLEGAADRSARFESALALVEGDGTVRVFEGICPGRITGEVLEGPHGFGYDPVFMPESREEPFSRLPPEEKDALGHRGEALRGLADHLGAAGNRS